MSRVGDSTHGIEASQDHDDKEKREERRAKSEQRRKKRKETPKEAAKGPQMRPPEGDQPFSTPCRPGLGPLATFRIAAFLQGRRPRGLIIPCKNAGILFRESSAEGRSEDGAFSPSWGSPGARRGTQNKFWKSEVATKLAASSNPCISTVFRGLIEEGTKVQKKKRY